MKHFKFKKNEAAKHGKNMPRVLLIGIGISMGIGMLLSMLFAKLILSGILPESVITVLAYGIGFVSAICGSAFASSAAPQRRLLVGMLCDATCLLLLSVIHAMLMQGAYKGLAAFCGCVLFGGLLGSLLGAKKKKSRRYA